MSGGESGVGLRRYALTLAAGWTLAVIVTGAASFYHQRRSIAAAYARGEPPSLAQLHDEAVQARLTGLGHAALWLVGLGGILAGMGRIAARIAERERVEQARQEAEAARAGLEHQLFQAQKIESIGRLSGGIAHDFNNLLTPILGYSGLLLARAELAPDLRTDIEAIYQASERARDLVSQLLAFSRKQVLDVRLIDLNEVVVGFERMLRRVIGEDVRVSLELRRPLASIRADRTQLEQVLMNLAVNARDAMPRGGQLTITTDERELTPDFAARNPGMHPGPVVELSVCDTGMGMAPDVLERLFEPFFTTKQRGRGTGLGLATVYGVVKQHDGYILVESAPGAGATFRMFFPRIEAAAEPEVRVPAAALTGGKERVLVLEDDENVLTFLRSVLASLGYRVMTAPDLDAALRLIAADGPPDLLVVDVVLPHGSGTDAARHLAGTAPGVGVLYISGYSNDVIAPHGVLAPGVHFLQKPFTPGALASKAREALAKRG